MSYSDLEMEAATELPRLREENDRLRAALQRIAYKPFGAADATHKEVLDAISDFAHETLEASPIVIRRAVNQRECP